MKASHDDSPSIPISSIVTSQTIVSLTLSPDAKRVIYQTSPLTKEGEHDVSTLWIAQTDKEGEARQLTSGLFNDRDPVIHPVHGQSVFFLSDRHKAGGKAHIYRMSLDAPSGEPVPFTDTGIKTAVQGFAISPDGKWIAYTSPDEDKEQEKRKEEKDDPKVYAGPESVCDFAKLRLVSADISGAKPKTIHSIRSDRHVLASTLTWSTDSSEIAFCTTESPRLEHRSFGETVLQKIDIRDANPKPVDMTSLHWIPVGNLIWPDGGELLATDYANYEFVTSACALCRVGVGGKDRVVYSGVENDLTDAKHVQHPTTGENHIVVSIAEGLESRIELLDKNAKKVSNLYTTDQEALTVWDAKMLADGQIAFAFVKSSGPRREVANIWFSKTTSLQNVATPIRLTREARWLEDLKLSVKTERFAWRGEDDLELEGIISYPSQQDDSEWTKLSKLPTILVVHGGPYARDMPHYTASHLSWKMYLASAGYCVLSPNYRGSSGRGTAFAEAATGGVGTLDWTDTLTMVQAAISRGIADPARLGIAGWSQGGFMSAYGIGQTKNLFKAAVVGAGVTEWNMIAMDGDLPDFELTLGGTKPWDKSKLPRNPIYHTKDIETAVLMLHGEKDERVPLSQATGFFRALQRTAKYPERMQLVVYPREGHVVSERKHSEDILRRVLEHFRTWL